MSHPRVKGQVSFVSSYDMGVDGWFWKPALAGNGFCGFKVRPMFLKGKEFKVDSVDFDGKHVLFDQFPSDGRPFSDGMSDVTIQLESTVSPDSTHEIVMFSGDHAIGVGAVAGRNLIFS
jgi:hypothetical protein